MRIRRFDSEGAGNCASKNDSNATSLHDQKSESGQKNPKPRLLSDIRAPSGGCCFVSYSRQRSLQRILAKLIPAYLRDKALHRNPPHSYRIRDTYHVKGFLGVRGTI